MITYVSLLRGINVSGQKVVTMADLKAVFQRVGFENVKTYIQSGNVIFETDKTAHTELVKVIESAIFLQYNFDVPAQVLSVLELKKIYARNPFIQKGVEDLKKLHVTFLDKEPDAEMIQEIEPDEKSEDEYHIEGKVVYLHCPNGYGKSKLSNNYFESIFNCKATTRNWKSVKKLIEMSM